METRTTYVLLSASPPGAAHLAVVPFVMGGDAAATQTLLNETTSWTEPHLSKEDFQLQTFKSKDGGRKFFTFLPRDGENCIAK